MLPNSLGKSKTESLFTKVRIKAYDEVPKRLGTFGMPDNIVIEDGRITIVEEAKMWSKRDFKDLADLAKIDRDQFIKEGLPPKRTSDKDAISNL